MPSPEERLLTLLESAQTTIGEAVELIALGSPDLKRKYQAEGRRLADLIRWLQKIAEGISAAAEDRRESPKEGAGKRLTMALFRFQNRVRRSDRGVRQ